MASLSGLEDPQSSGNGEGYSRGGVDSRYSGSSSHGDESKHCTVSDDLHRSLRHRRRWCTAAIGRAEQWR
ncbi:hypothetical protein M6B38_217560 [Iris pallida]|uniref:Uncharacterized protein n=1 Tax=Iris pallida TaxID=29817 RepID=A0AAX6E0K8_IRIPA|nr:hypothetical protein M6B38_217560 [Iris pallida]